MREDNKKSVRRADLHSGKCIRFRLTMLERKYGF